MSESEMVVLPQCCPVAPIKIFLHMSAISLCYHIPLYAPYELVALNMLHVICIAFLYQIEQVLGKKSEAPCRFS